MEKTPTGFSTARRATDRDHDVLARLCSEAGAQSGTLWSVRKPALAPAAWLASRVPVVVVEDAGAVGFAAALAENVPLGVARCAEAILYVRPSQRRRGAGRAAMSELLAAARVMGLWKVVAYILPEDVAARTLLERVDFRPVGVLVKHAQVLGGWRDVALFERLVLAARKSVPSIDEA